MSSEGLCLLPRREPVRGYPLAILPRASRDGMIEQFEHQTKGRSSSSSWRRQVLRVSL